MSAMESLAPSVGASEPDVARSGSVGAAGQAGGRACRARSARPILWRLHYLGGFLPGPVVLSLCITGILFAWAPQIDQARFGHITARSTASAATPADALLPLSAQVEAARRTRPDWNLFAVSPATAHGNTVVLLDPPGGELVDLDPPYGPNGRQGPDDLVLVHVDPATGKVTGEIANADRADPILGSWHSSWRLGPFAEPLTELASTWFLVSLVTGAVLWLPTYRKRETDAFAIRKNLRGRLRSREIHQAIGIILIVPMAMFPLTGLTRTNYAGSRVPTIEAALAAQPRIADTGLVADGPAAREAAAIDRVAASAAEAGLVEPVRLFAPTAGNGGWLAASLDVTYPLDRDQLVVDGADGNVVQRIDFADQPWLTRLKVTGVLFHHAQLYGIAHQILMTVFTLAVMVLVAHGYVMWWRRRPSGGLGVPVPVRDWARNAPRWVLVFVTVVAWLSPTLGLSVVVWLGLERVWRWFVTHRS